MCLEAWDNTGDEGYLGAIVEDYCLDECIDILLEAPVKNPDGSITDPDKHIDEKNMNTGLTLGDRARGLWGYAKYGATKVGDEYKGLGSDIKAGWGQEGIKNKAKGIGSALGKHKAAVAGAGVATAAAGYGVYRFAKWVNQARNKPKSWIGQKIAALRGIYQKWMQAAQRNPQQAGMIKSACAKIMSIIDALLAKLQSAAG